MNGLRFVLAATTAIVVDCAATIAVSGYGEDSLRAAIRLTARTSLLLFLTAFTASAARRAWKNPATAWLRRNRRYLGLGFAASHAIHLAAILALTRFGAEFDATTVVVGGVGYLFIFLLAVTSNDRSVRALGPWWARLHTTGVYYLWFVFLATYAPAIPANVAADIAVPLLIASLALRIRFRPGPTKKVDRPATV